VFQNKFIFIENNFALRAGTEARVYTMSDEQILAVNELIQTRWFNDAVATGSLVETSLQLKKHESEHYVMGARSPFYFRFGVNSTNKHIVAAVFSTQHATNMGGMMQGGAISSIFDAMTATVGSVVVEPMAFGTTKSLTVMFKAPTPLRTVLKFSVLSASFSMENGTGVVRAQLSDGLENGEIYALCEAELVDIKRRKKWKMKMKQSSTTSKL
jgi:hypothetical protein